MEVCLKEQKMELLKFGGAQKKKLKNFEIIFFSKTRENEYQYELKYIFVIMCDYYT
jgi:hypothetical protein